VALPGRSWKGYILVDDSVLKVGACLDQGFAAIDCVRALELPLPGSGNTALQFWYGPVSPGYYFQFWWVMDHYQGRAGDCVSLPDVIGYWVDFKNFAQITCGAQSAGAMPNPNAPGVTSYGWWVDTCCGLPYTWSHYQGVGGANPSAIKNMTSTDWRTWAQRQSYDRLRSLLRTGISAAPGWHALASIEITAANPNFECKGVYPVDNPSPDNSEACRQYFTSATP
jgi:hypothetical protein